MNLNLHSDEFVVSAESINLSCNGLYCRVDRLLPMMASLKIVLTILDAGLPGDVEFIECCGVVVRVEETDEAGMFDIAIFFNEIDEFEKKKLAMFLESLL